MKTENFQFSNTTGKLLSGRIYSSGKKNNRGMIFSHGLFSSKDGYKITTLASSIINSEIDLMTFDFTFSGESGSNIEDITIAQEVNDLASAVEEFSRRGRNEIILAGSSMGGVVTLIYGAENQDKIKSIITIATPADLKELLYTNTDFKEDDIIDPNEKTLFDTIPLSNRFSIELKTIDMLHYIQKISVPVLILQGQGDAIVPPENADLIKKHLAGISKIVIIEDGDHHLSDNQSLKIIEKELIEWCRI